MGVKYSMYIQWSDEDRKYIVTLPEFGGGKTHGDTYEEAAKNGREVLELLIETDQELGRPLPEPNLFVIESDADLDLELEAKPQVETT